MCPPGFAVGSLLNFGPSPLPAALQSLPPALAAVLTAPRRPAVLFLHASLPVGGSTNLASPTAARDFVAAYAAVTSVDSTTAASSPAGRPMNPARQNPSPRQTRSPILTQPNRLS